MLQETLSDKVAEFHPSAVVQMLRHLKAKMAGLIPPQQVNLLSSSPNQQRRFLESFPDGGRLFVATHPKR